jgi:hypothetical protein
VVTVGGSSCKTDEGGNGEAKDVLIDRGEVATVRAATSESRWTSLAVTLHMIQHAPEHLPLIVFHRSHSCPACVAEVDDFEDPFGVNCHVRVCRIPMQPAQVMQGRQGGEKSATSPGKLSVSESIATD